MKILVISDTHGQDMPVELAVEKEKPFDMLIHCGDVQERDIFIEALVSPEAACVIISGNVDGFCDLDREKKLELLGHRILVTHGVLYGVREGTDRLIYTARERGCDIVLYGHTHIPLIQRKDGVLVLNPGSLALPHQADEKRSYAVLSLEYGKEPEAEIRHL